MPYCDTCMRTALGFSNYMFHISAHQLPFADVVLQPMYVSYINSPTPFADVYCDTCMRTASDSLTYMFVLYINSPTPFADAVLRPMHAHGLKAPHPTCLFQYQLLSQMPYCSPCTRTASSFSTNMFVSYINSLTPIADAVLLRMYVHGLKDPHPTCLFQYQLSPQMPYCSPCTRTASSFSTNMFVSYINSLTPIADAILQPMHAHGLGLLNLLTPHAFASHTTTAPSSSMDAACTNTGSTVCTGLTHSAAAEQLVCSLMAVMPAFSNKVSSARYAVLLLFFL